MSDNHVIGLPVVLQYGLADCGYACLTSCVRHFADAEFEYPYRAADDDVAAWTIELFLRLAERSDLSVQMFTTFAGANPLHRRNTFYADDWSGQVARVDSAFASARARGFSVTERRLTRDDLIRAVCSGRACICAVDYRYVHCAQCTAVTPLDTFARASHPHFVGHFVVVHGVDDGFFAVMNPSRTCVGAFCRVTMNDVDRARSAVGTDDDVIIVSSAL